MKGVNIHAVHEYLNEINGKPFEWGKTDCVTLVFTLVGKYIGYDLSDVLGHWNSLKSAREYSKSVEGIEEQRRVLKECCNYYHLARTSYAGNGDVLLDFSVDQRLKLPDCAFVFGGKFITSTWKDGVTAVRFNKDMINELWGRP